MTLYGFDIGKDQWGIDVSRIPHDFAIIGASDGGAVNPVFHQQYATEKALGKGRGAYHFFRGNAQAEAAFFVANAGEVPGDGQIWCDAETFFPDLPQRTLGWLEEVRRLTGVKPSGAYTPADFLLNRGLDWSPVHNAGYALWEAAYVAGYQPIAAYNVPGGRADVPLWGSPAMWQFTSTGQVPGWGSGIDLNVFYGDQSAFDALINGGVSAQSGTITPIQEDFMATLSDDEKKVLMDAAARINGFLVQRYDGNKQPARALDTLDGNQLRQDIAASTARAVAETSSAFHQLQPGLIAIAAGVGALKNQPAATAPAIDVPALAAQIAAALNATQAHDFLVAFRNALPAN